MNNFFIALLLISLLCIFIFIIQALINLAKRYPAKKAFKKAGISAIVLIASFVGFGITSGTLTTNNNNSEPAIDVLSSEKSETTSIANNNNSEPATETLSLDNSESVSTDSDIQNVTDLFKSVYLPYANRENPWVFNLVKQFAQSTDYEITITEPSSETMGTIKLTAENGDYVYFNFKPLDDIDIIMTINYYQTASESEVSLSNYSSDGSPQYDRYTTHVLGELESDVSSTQEQQLFLFNK